jgi:signal transduction histidine kinase
VHEVLVEAEALMAPQFASKGLHLDTTDCATDAIVCADRAKLLQVIINLLANALRFTDAGGTVGIACDTRPDWVHVRVSDTGIGIPVELRKRIFEPFTQADSGHTRRAGGTGLGLAISRRLAEAMGGTLSVESAVGEGSCFVLSLPAMMAAHSDMRA